MAKTNPIGVRIKDDKLSFIKESEGLKTVQQVVSFLVEKYYWEKKIGLNPIMQRAEPVKTVEIPKITEFKLSQFDSYKIEIKDSTSMKSLQATVKALKEELGLSIPQKVSLENYALEISKSLFND